MAKNNFTLNYLETKAIKKSGKIVRRETKEATLKVSIFFEERNREQIANLGYGFNSHYTNHNVEGEKYRLHQSIRPNKTMKLIHDKSGREFTFDNIITAFPMSTADLMEGNKKVATIYTEDYYKD